MSTVTGALIALLAFSGAGAPLLQEAGTDDWEFAENAARSLTIAAVRYDDGKAVVAQCRAGELKLVINGVTVAADALPHYDASRADGRRDVQVWTAEGGALTSDAAARDARFLRGGGALTLRTSGGQGPNTRMTFDLPTEHANLDRVLTACGKPVEDARDSLARYVAPPPAETPDRQPKSRSRPTGYTDLSCIIRDGRYRDCRVENTSSRREGEESRRALEGDSVSTADEATPNESVVFLRLTTVVEFVPA